MQCVLGKTTFWGAGTLRWREKWVVNFSDLAKVQKDDRKDRDFPGSFSFPTPWIVNTILCFTKTCHDWDQCAKVMKWINWQMHWK